MHWRQSDSSSGFLDEGGAIIELDSVINPTGKKGDETRFYRLTEATLGGRPRVGCVNDAHLPPCVRTLSEGEQIELIPLGEMGMNGNGDQLEFAFGDWRVHA